MNASVSFLLFIGVMLFVIATIWIAKRCRLNEIKTYIFILIAGVVIGGTVWGVYKYREYRIERRLAQEGIPTWATVNDWDYGNLHRPHRRKRSLADMRSLTLEYWANSQKFVRTTKACIRTLDTLEYITANAPQNCTIFVQIKYADEDPETMMIIKEEDGKAVVSTEKNELP